MQSVYQSSHGRLVSVVPHSVRHGVNAVVVLAARAPAVAHHVSAVRIKSILSHYKVNFNHKSLISLIQCDSSALRQRLG